MQRTSVSNLMIENAKAPTCETLAAAMNFTVVLYNKLSYLSDSQKNVNTSIVFFI